VDGRGRQGGVDCHVHSRAPVGVHRGDSGHDGGAGQGMPPVAITRIISTPCASVKCSCFLPGKEKPFFLWRQVSALAHHSVRLVYGSARARRGLAQRPCVQSVGVTGCQCRTWNANGSVGSFCAGVPMPCQKDFEAPEAAHPRQQPSNLQQQQPSNLVSTALFAFHNPSQP